MSQVPPRPIRIRRGQSSLFCIPPHATYYYFMHIPYIIILAKSVVGKPNLTIGT